MNVASRLLFPLALLAASSGLLAQDAIEPYVEYRKRVEASQNISPLEHGLFGEQVSLYNGSTSFSVTDIDLPGNNALPVRLTRRLSIELQPQNIVHSYDALLRGVGNWDVDVPYMAGTYLVSAGNALRCDGDYAPWMAPVGFNRGDIWQGVTVNLPDRGITGVLGLPAALPRPSDGATYTLTTAERDVFSCIPMKPGFSGQGFRMTTARGCAMTSTSLLRAPPRRSRDRLSGRDTCRRPSTRRATACTCWPARSRTASATRWSSSTTRRGI